MESTQKKDEWRDRNSGRRQVKNRNVWFLHQLNCTQNLSTEVLSVTRQLNRYITSYLK